MPKFRKKPVVIEAVQFTQEMADGVVVAPDGVQNMTIKGMNCAGIETLEGDHEVSVGDWVITGIKGERYPCKPDIFEATYEPVEDATTS